MRAKHRLRRRRPGLLAAVVAALSALALVLGPTALDGARASFSATTANTGDELVADQLQPPSSLTVSQACGTAPFITQRAAATTDIGTASVTLPVPTAVEAGDILVAHVAYHDGAVTLNMPANWNRMGQTTDSGDHVTSAVFWKTATGTESSAAFAQPAGTSTVMAAGLVAFAGARLPTAAGFASSTGSGTTATTPSVSNSSTNVTVVHMLSKTREALPVPSGTTGLFGEVNAPGSGGVGVRGAVETVSSGATTARGVTGAESSAWVTHTLVLQRAPYAQLSWPASSTSSWADGYVLARAVAGGATATSTLSASSTSTTQGPLAAGASYTFSLTTAKGTWRSDPVTRTFTSTC